MILKKKGVILFKKDSASPLFRHELQNVLIVGFLNRLNGTGGTTTWLPRSPDFLSVGSFCGVYKVPS